MDSALLVPIVFILFVAGAAGYLIWGLFQKNTNGKPKTVIGTIWKIVQVLVLLGLAWAFFDFFLHGPRV